MNQEIITVKKKKWYKNKWLYIIVVAVILIGGVVYSQFVKKDKGPQYETTKVERGDLEQTVDATGNVESADEVGLRFETVGRVATIYKNANDEVKKGEVIATLDLQSLNAAVAQASANVNKAQAELDKILAGSTSEYINSLKAKVDQSKANLDQTSASYDDQISDAKSSVESAENDLELAIGGEDSQIVQDAYDDMLALLNSIQNTLVAALTEADNILGIDNTLANDDFESVLSARDTSKLNTAKNKYYLAKSAKIDLDSLVSSLTTADTHEKIDWAVDTAEESLFSMKELMFATTQVLDNTTPIGNLTQAELDTLKLNVQTDYTAVNTKYTSLIDQKQAINSAKSSYISYKIAYDKTVANLENLQKKRVADLSAYLALVNQAEANYNDAKNPPRVEDVSSYEAGLSAMQAALAQAAANRNKAIIFAPVDGVVGKVNVKVGEYTSSQEDAIKIVSPHFEIKVDIPETDIVKISLNDSAQVKMDAFGDYVVFDAVVSEIEIGETIIQDVVYYTVTLSLEEDGEHQILNGMTADVLFFTEKKENVLYVSQRAVRSDESGRYVRILENGDVKEIKVKTGLRGDNGLVEIVEGLKEGQELIVKVIE